MKFLKTLSILFVLIASSLNAQTDKNQWSELKNVQQVADRIERNIEQDNAKAAAHFTKTLLNQTQQLIKSGVPESHKTANSGKDLTELNARAEQLAKIAQTGTAAELKKSFESFKQQLNLISKTNK